MGNVPTELRLSNRTQAQQKNVTRRRLKPLPQHPHSRSKHVRTDPNY